MNKTKKFFTVLFLFLIGQVGWGKAITYDRSFDLDILLGRVEMIMGRDSEDITEDDKQLLDQMILELNSYGLRTPSLTWRFRKVIVILKEIKSGNIE